MADLALMLEAEKRGLLPPDQTALLTEARGRGLVPGGTNAAPRAAAPPQRTFLGAVEEGLGTAGSAIYDAAKGIQDFQNNPMPYLESAGKSIGSAATGVSRFAKDPAPYLKSAGENIKEIAGNAGSYVGKELAADFAKQHPGVYGLVTNNAPPPESTLQQDVYGQIAEHPFTTCLLYTSPSPRDS